MPIWQRAGNELHANTLDATTMQRSLVLAALAAAIAAIFVVPSRTVTSAAERVVSLQGEVTAVNDELNWFNDSIQVGMPVAGSYNFFDTGYLLGTYIGDTSELTYEYLLQPDPNFNLPVLPVNMHLAIGGHDYNTAGPNPIRYAINVFNDSNGFVVGDAYQVQSPLPFPAPLYRLGGRLGERSRWDLLAVSFHDARTSRSDGDSVVVDRPSADSTGTAWVRVGVGTHLHRRL